MKIYSPSNWQSISGNFPIVVEYRNHQFPSEEMQKLLEKTFGNEESIDDLATTEINANLTELKRRFSQLEVTSGNDCSGNGSIFCIVKTAISAEKLYEIINWDACQKIKKEFVQNGLNKFQLV